MHSNDITHIIYLIHNNTKDIYYIGQTNNWRRRGAEHGMDIPSYRRNSKQYFKKPEKHFSGNPFIAGAIADGDELEYTWLTICPNRRTADQAEIYWIQKFKDNGYTLYNRTCGGGYDSNPQVKSVDISEYPIPEMLPLDRVASILKDPQLLREDRTCYGLEKRIRKALLDQTSW